MSEKRIVHLSEEEDKHWVNKYLWARDKEAEYKALKEEAKEMWLDIVGEEWDVIEVDGIPVFENVRTSPNRLSVAKLKAKYPEIYHELCQEIPQTAIKVFK